MEYVLIALKSGFLVGMMGLGLGLSVVLIILRSSIVRITKDREAYIDKYLREDIKIVTLGTAMAILGYLIL